MLKHRYLGFLDNKIYRQKYLPTNNTTMTPKPKHIPKRVTPQQQLWSLTNPDQQKTIRELFRRIKKRDQEDLCYGIVAYIRFGIQREYPSEFMQTMYETLIDLTILK